MIKKLFTKNRLLLLILLSIILASVALVIKQPNSPMQISLTKPSEESFQAPGKNWNSPKKVEDYYLERLHMTPAEAKEARSSKGSDGKITLRLTQGTTLSALLSNLEYYGFVRDEKALKYALEHSVDKLPGRTDALRVGNNTVDIYASYRISEDMTAWEIADQLLNHPSYFAFDEYRYLFMP